MEKYISFGVPLKVQNKHDKMETFRLKFVDSQRFMNSSLAKLVGYLSDIKETCKETDKFINNMRSSASIKKSINNYSKLDKKETHEFTDNLRAKTTSLLRHTDRYEEICNKIKMRDLKERFPNTYQLCDDDLNKFMLLLRKGVYPYQYTDSSEKFNKTTLPTKEEFYDPLNIEDISKEDHADAQKVWDTFNIQNLDEYHDLYVQLDTLLVHFLMYMKILEIYA